MRPLVIAGAVAGLAALSGLVLVGGRSLDQPSINIGLDDVPTEIPTSDDAQGEATAAVNRQADEAQSEAAPASDAAGLQRIAPRAPLSELSLALPPKPAMPDEWKGTILHRAVAPSAGVIEAMGYRVAIAGIDPVATDETCSADGKDWDCGVYARTAFRAFLRGRSPTCTVPPEPDRELVAADCRIGKQDVGDWLVSNGWARAVAGGAYVDAQARAEEKKLGIFGPQPSKDGLPALPESYPPIEATVRDTPSIDILVPDESGASSFETPTPPIDRTAPFPPAPASP